MAAPLPRFKLRILSQLSLNELGLCTTAKFTKKLFAKTLIYSWEHVEPLGNRSRTQIIPDVIFLRKICRLAPMTRFIA